MNIKEFINQANLTPLLKEYKGIYEDITEKTLKKIGFIKKEYSVEDLIKLKKMLTDFNFPEMPKTLQGRKAKDIYHTELIKRYHNQKLILDWRKKLRIPLKGFGAGFQFKKWINKSTKDFQYIKNGKQITTKFCQVRYSGDIKNAIILKEKVSQKEALELALNEILKKWNLPKRYRSAIQELLLLNRIVPAASGTFWITSETGWGAKKIKGVTFDRDTTKEEILKLLNQKAFAKEKKELFGSTHRKPKKEMEIQKTIKLYNQLKEGGKKDKDIFTAISHRYGLPTSTIRKRIRGR